jgi:hypothetical protein
MKFFPAKWLISKMSLWLLKNGPPKRAYLCDFETIAKEIQPGDVLLIEGRNRVSRIIQQMTKSPWTHAALYLGTLSTIADEQDRDQVHKLHPYNVTQQLILESEVGEGTIVSPLEKYKDDHIRILRPMGLNAEEIQKVIHYALGSLGIQYSIRHIFDLARFLLPWGFITGQFRSTLFQKAADQPTQDICSSVIAAAFHSIHYPVLPLVQKDYRNSIELIQRNPRLFTPSDFDYSPYFSVVKYPIFKLGTVHSLKDLPWRKGLISDDIEIKNIPSDDTF